MNLFIPILLCISLVHGLKTQKERQWNRDELEDHDRQTERSFQYALCEEESGDMYYYKRHSFIDQQPCKKEIAVAKYSNHINKTGWAHVEVEINQKYEIPLYKQGYAAGFVEGRATWDLIDLHIKNTVDGYCDGASAYCEELNEFLLENFVWMLDEIEKHPEDDYWKQVNLTVNQLYGMIDGYEGSLQMGPRDLRDVIAHPIYLIQLAGDLEDLQAKFKKPENPNRMKTSRGHCSALVKVLPHLSDILFSHVTWTTYSSMLRMQKKYSWQRGHSGYTYSFSSYPGSIASVDDFIVTSSHLAIFETTIGNYNQELYNHVLPSSVLCWIRTQVAHRTSASGLQWAEAFAKHNSGTYNNQWVVLDYKKFKRGRKEMHSHGLLHVLEQMPRHIVHGDKTKHLLDHTYWPSYNSPYFPQIFNWSQTNKMVEKHGDWYSYDKTPRALIFKRDHKKVKCMDSMTKLMRSNDYKNDPLSRCDCKPPYSAENAISCRSDLNPANGTYPIDSLGFRDHGATDMKLVNSKLIQSLQFAAIAGPTHDPTPVFDWDTAPFKHKVSHLGQPKRWTFPSVVHKWSPVRLIEDNQRFLEMVQFQH